MGGLGRLPARCHSRQIGRSATLRMLEVRMSWIAPLPMSSRTETDEFQTGQHQKLRAMKQVARREAAPICNKSIERRDICG
jgi:hypothetical protein